jgi:hypothetical protein
MAVVSSARGRIAALLAHVARLVEEEALREVDAERFTVSYSSSRSTPSAITLMP